MKTVLSNKMEERGDSARTKKLGGRRQRFNKEDGGGRRTCLNREDEGYWRQ